MTLVRNLILLNLALGLLHCTNERNSSLSRSRLLEKQKLAATTSTKTTTSTGVSIKVPDLFTSNKSFIQTRGVLSLRLTDTYVEDLTEISLINDTTKKSLVSKLPISSGLVGDDAILQLAQQDADVIIKIYPGLKSTRSKMNYGTNSLRLVAVAADVERYSSGQFRLKDFLFFDVAYNSRGEDDSSEGNPISGGLTPFAQGISSTASGGSILYTNLEQILTH